MMNRQQFSITTLCLITAVATNATTNARAAETVQGTPVQNRFFDSVVETEEEGKSVLIIPMEGQMHTDINHTVYANVADRIKALNPDLIIIEIFSRDYKSEWIKKMGQGNPWYQDPDELNRHYVAKDLIDIAKVFNIQLKGIKQVAWVKDSSGPSTMLALSWSTLYMSPDARLQGTFAATRQAYDIKNVDTRGKILEFNQIHCEILANYAERNTALLRAFIDPPENLSGTWEGQKVKWQDDTAGDFVVDDSDGVPRLSATFATEVGISRSITPTRNSVLLAEGIREYHIVGQDITDDILAQSIKWRSDYDNVLEAMSNSEIYMSLANGEQTYKYLNDQLGAYKRVLRILEKSPGYTHPWPQPLGVALRSNRSEPYTDTQTLKQWIKQVEEQLKELREGKNDGRGGGRGGGRRPGSGGGGR
jgi:hypothetical protein